MDMGGQRDFRNLWIGEASQAECVIFMIDAYARERFQEARDELWKLSDVFKKKPLIILANKYDLQPVASLGEIIDALRLEDIPSFEILPISCKTGFGIVKSFMKIYYKLTGKKLKRKISPKAVTVFDRGGIPLTSTTNEDILQGGLFAAINSFVQESFNAELNQLKLDGFVIVFKRSKNLMGSIIIKDSESINIDSAEEGLYELLTHLEHMCPEIEQSEYDNEKLSYLLEQYASNIL
jgi:GTPase SAR1 family protein